MSEEIYVNALNLTPYFVRQDGAHYCFRGVPKEIQDSFSAVYIEENSLRTFNLYIFGRASASNFIKVSHESSRSIDILFGLNCVFHFINSDEDYALYLAYYDRTGIYN